MPTPNPPLRGRRGRDRRIAERVATEFAARYAPPTREALDEVLDFDVAEVDREVEDEQRRSVASATKPREPRRPALVAPAAGSAARISAHRLPDLSALPPLLAGTGTFAALRERLGRPTDDPRRVGRHIGLVSVPHGAKSYLAAALALGSAGERLVWIGRDAEIGDRVAEELGAWLGDPSAVATLEPRTSLAYERSELIADETAARVAALAAWRSGHARVLVASVQALLQHTIAPDDLPASPRALRPGMRVHQESLLRELFDLGYVPVTEVAGRGEFARRGGIVDIFPPSLSLPIRIEFFGDEIDSLRAFDPTDQRTVSIVDAAVLLPASEFLLPAGGASAIRDRLGRKAARLPERLAADLERFESAPLEARQASDATRAMSVGDAAEVWAAHLAPATGLDHLEPGTLLVLDEPGDLAEAAGFLWRQADERRAELIDAGELPADWPSGYLGPREWKGRLVASRTLELTWESVPPEDSSLARGALSSGDPFGWREPALPPGRAGRLVEAVDAWREDGARIVLASDQAPRLAELLAEDGRHTAVVRRVGEAPPPGAVVLVERSLNGGFSGGPDGLTFVTDHELFGTVRIRRPKALRRVVPRDILERLTPGDLVVHIDHGVARYEQMLRRGGAGEDRDYLELSFAGGDRIFVPVEQIARISRYSGGERPALSKLGGTDWLRAKQRVRKAVDDLAEDLLQLYATRAQARGHAFADDTPWQAEMEASFPYEETIDQLRAALEVKADMEQIRPMDRLVVGDVGYGKTEVALRAAFKAAADGKQVLFLVPTTILAQQHYGTFTERLRDYPFRVELLSRFRTAKDQRAVVKDFAEGKVDILIGTHRLLSRDIDARELGLVIIDEEQRFGVRQKDMLRQLRLRVDVLSLSATPIPRTLQMSLAGLRDISVIETPPEGRRPIHTYVGEFDDELVKGAIEREVGKEGQVFYLHDRVETIDEAAERLRALCPSAAVAVAHGQMEASALERTMLDFLQGKINVLVSTTIIESGLDIPQANTLIVERADRLGLAQLYQIRGRVGRSRERAYAYLLYPSAAALSGEAAARLATLSDYTELGSGFKIAMRDLEIRGAGNLLGEEQSGHVAAVGFELYCQMLDEAVEAISSEDGDAEREGLEPVRLDVPVDAYIPGDYIPYEVAKIDVHRRIAAARDLLDLERLSEELEDRFGPVPEPVENLIRLQEARIRLGGIGARTIEFKAGRLVVAPLSLDSAQVHALREAVPEAVYESLKRTLRVPVPRESDARFEAVLGIAKSLSQASAEVRSAA
jgi:transcription-repair coupling factor (superfamily II helicase)